MYASQSAAQAQKTLSQYSAENQNLLCTMAVENLKVIDFASINKEGNTVLTISDHLKWDDNNEHLLMLQNKINVYLSAIETGNLYGEYPDAKGRNIIINIVAQYEPDENARLFLNTTEKILQSAGYGFEFSILKND